MSARVGIIYYSTWGHIRKLAETVAEGVKEAGATPVIYQVPETLPEEILKKMHAAPKADHPVLTHDKLGELKELDGYIFGLPTRYGMMPAQMKTFFDGLGQLWQAGALNGKPAAVFFSTSSQGGGQETTALTAVTQFAHLGMIFIPMGYTDPSMFDLKELHGGSPYGAGTYSGGDGSRQPTALELNLAKHQGRYTAKIMNQLKKGAAAK
jgi:NAD(P)H dehydrogenase (quinone)